MTVLKKKFMGSEKRMNKSESAEKIFGSIPEEKLIKLILAAFLFAAAIPLIVIFWNGLFLFKAADYNPDNIMSFSLVLTSYNYIWNVMIQLTGQICLILSGLIWLGNYFRNKAAGIRTGAALIPILIFGLFFWCLLSALFSDSWDISFMGSINRQEGFMTYTAYLGYFFGAYYFRREDLLRKYFYTFTAIAAAVVLPNIMKNNSLSLSLGMVAGAESGIFNNSNHAGYYICLAVMTSALLFLTQENEETKKSRALQLLPLAFFTYMVYAQLRNHSFGSYLGELIALAVLTVLLHILCLRRKCFAVRYLQKARLLLLVFLLVSAVFSFFDAWLLFDFSNLFPSLRNLLAGTKKEKEKAGSSRGILIIRALQFVKEKPLFGYGPDNLLEQYAKYGISEDRAHCVPLNIAASEGIPAAILYLAALFAYFRKFVRETGKTGIFDSGLFAIGLAYFSSSLVGNSTYYVTPYFCIIFGCAVGRIFLIRVKHK